MTANYTNENRSPLPAPRLWQAGLPSPIKKIETEIGRWGDRVKNHYHTTPFPPFPEIFLFFSSFL
jgi:hypothetical protein